MVGRTLEPMLRIYLSGDLTVEADDRWIRGSSFPGRQGREAFAFLTLRNGVLVPRADLASALWTGALPGSWDTALSAIVSKLRTQLSAAGLDGSDLLRSMDGCYRLSLPPTTWVDHAAAFEGIHQAEVALKRGDFRSAYGPSAVARAVCQRPFLAGSDSEWIRARRVKLRNTLVRALECRCLVYLANGENTLAVEVAREAVSIEPFRESCYRLLMKAQVESGNAAEALRVYERCRLLLSDELGVSPSQQTREMHSAILEAL